MFIQDPSEAVVLWGIKAARWIIPAQLGQVAAQPDLALVNEIVPAVQKHPKGTIGGAIAIDAYDALTLGIPSNPNLIKSIKSAVIKLMIGPVQDLLSFRVGLYVQGVPPEPRAEKIGANFLTTLAAWTVQTNEQKLKTMQLLANLVALAAAQAQQANTADANELIGVIQLTAKCMTVVVGPGPVANALLPATQLGRGANAQQIKAAVDPILPALQADPNFKAIVAPPAVKGHEAAPPPASAPTTGPVIIPGVGIPPPPPAPGAGPPAGVRPATRPTTGPAGAPPSGARPTTPTPPPGPRPTSPAPAPTGGPRPTTPPPTPRR